MANKGKITKIIGPVVDVKFEQELPGIYQALEVFKQSSDKSEKERVVLEVQQQLEGNKVRTISMGSTDGLSRGMEVIDTGQLISTA